MHPADTTSQWPVARTLFPHAHPDSRPVHLPSTYMANMALTFSLSISLPGPALTTSPRDITT